MRNLPKKLFGGFVTLLVVTFLLGAFLNVRIPVLTDLVAMVVNPILGLFAGNPIGAARSIQTSADQLNSFPVGKIILWMIGIFVLVVGGIPLLNWALKRINKNLKKAEGAFHGDRDHWFTIGMVLVFAGGYLVTKDWNVLYIAAIVFTVDFVGKAFEKIVASAITTVFSAGITGLVDKAVDVIQSAFIGLMAFAWLLAAMPALQAFVRWPWLSAIVNALSSVANGNRLLLLIGIIASLIAVAREFQEVIWE